MHNICGKKSCGWYCMGKYCPKCGGRTIPRCMPCPYCKKEVNIDSTFCGECGRPVQEEVNAFVDNKRREVREEEEEECREMARRSVA